MTTKEMLTEARSLIKKGWTQGSFAKDVNGNEVDPKSSQAVSWCSLGAMEAACYCPRDSRLPILDILRRAAGTCVISDWNDHPNTTKEEILAAFDKAIELANG
jgi:hypothetical protein